MMIRSFLPLLLLAALTVSCARAPYATPEQTRGPLDKADDPGPKSCGGRTVGPQPTCDSGDYCHYEPAATCGWADAQGVCMSTPETCIKTFTPVCGCDGATYSNSCFANMAGTSVQHEGACAEPEPEPTSYCLNDAGCGQGSFCDMSECHMPPCPEGMACAQVCHGICAAKMELPASVQIGNPVGPIAPDTASTALSITGDTLTISVTYSGGCEKHDFELFWAGTFLESSPVQAALVLTHDAHGDACKALITDKVSFDLTPLKAAYQSGYKTDAGTISIRVGSLSIFYTFG